jgi:hypothetical protein
MKPSDEHADSVFYGIAVEEIQAGIIDNGLMAKAITKAGGDNKRAEALYIEWSVDLLKEATTEVIRRRQEAAVEEFRRRQEYEKAELFKAEKEEKERRKVEKERTLRMWEEQRVVDRQMIEETKARRSEKKQSVTKKEKKPREFKSFKLMYIEQPRTFKVLIVLKIITLYFFIKTFIL